MRDQDSGDCRTIKQQLQDKCRAAGRPQTLVRIVCREIESWYLGDLAATARAMKLPELGAQQRRARFRNPDQLTNAAEVLAQLTQCRYQKIGDSRMIGPELSLEANSSPSFRCFIHGIRRLVAAAAG